MEREKAEVETENQRLAAQFRQTKVGIQTALLRLTFLCVLLFSARTDGVETACEQVRDGRAGQERQGGRVQT